MTDAEKKMKKYVNQMERRLELPRDIRTRVMSDFSSSIAARREAGMTDREIYAELGTPKEAAAVLNEQMQEFAYRKSPWRFLFAAVAAGSGLWILLYLILQSIGLLLPTLNVSLFPNYAASIGIIGGADGPTAIFVTGPTLRPDWDLILAGLLMIVGIAGCLRLRKCRKK